LPKWTPEQIKMLTRLWKSRPASEIADILGDGFTRNAVIGKANRLKLGSKKALTIRPPESRPPETLLPEDDASEPLLPDPSSPSLPPGFLIAELPIPRGRCCWPDDVSRKRPATAWCGQPVARGQFCAEHAARAFVKARAPKEAA